MAAIIDYFLTPQSPWTYLGHQRFSEITARRGCEVRIKPCDFGRVYAASGGLPLHQRAEQRQAYRLIELQRFSAWLGIPLNLHPKFFPVAPEKAARLILAAGFGEPGQERVPQVMHLVGLVAEAVWVKDQNIADDTTLIALADRAGFDGSAVFRASGEASVEAQYHRMTEEAIKAQVFGAPTYVFCGELFWGQDRLEFLERALDHVRA